MWWCRILVHQVTQCYIYIWIYHKTMDSTTQLFIVMLQHFHLWCNLYLLGVVDERYKYSRTILTAVHTLQPRKYEPVLLCFVLFWLWYDFCGFVWFQLARLIKASPTWLGPFYPRKKSASSHIRMFFFHWNWPIKKVLVFKNYVNLWTYNGKYVDVRILIFKSAYELTEKEKRAVIYIYLYQKILSFSLSLSIAPSLYLSICNNTVAPVPMKTPKVMGKPTAIKIRQNTTKRESYA